MPAADLSGARRFTVRGPVVAGREPRPTIAEIREVGQPPSVTGRRTAEHWTADLYLRRISPYVTAAALSAGWSANAVTWAMIATGLAAAASLAIPGLAGPLVAATLAQLQLLWDASDGEVARWRGVSGATGIFLDKIGHFTAESAIPVMLGVHVALASPNGERPWWLLAGAMSGLLILLNKSFNEMVHSARAHAGFAKVTDSDAVSAPRRTMVARLRAAARFFPVHKMFHSIELTLVIAVVAVVAAVIGDQWPMRWLLALLPAAIALSAIGHLVAILTSSRLKP